ncbi:hypothetical protein K1719_031067 [Acacia pycnantha]|nr:hypothetical protein K1719_031067 [Acacia pycnantha]
MKSYKASISIVVKLATTIEYVDLRMSVANGNEPCFGSWTTTSQCRNSEESLEVVRNNWEEAIYFRRKKEEAISCRRREHSQELSRDSKALDEELFFIKLSSSSRLGRDGESPIKMGGRSLSVEEVDVADRASGEKRGNQTYTTNPQEEVKTFSRGGSLREVTIEENLYRVSLAMVPYCGDFLKEVTNILSGLGLKRGAEVELELSRLKRRKMNIVESGPNTNVISTYAGNLRKIKTHMRRLNICRGILLEWSRKEFQNFRKIIDQLRSRIYSCYEGILTLEKLQEAENLVGLIEETWIREETYWWQRSRISWLKSGDQNTKFFHSSVIQRRQRKEVLRLKGEDGVWLEERMAINNSFNKFYRNLFSSGGSRSMEQALSYVKKVVTEGDNMALMRPMTDLEIEKML